MYVFGGDFTTTNDTPLWTFNFREKVWGKQADKSWVSSAQVTRLDFRLLFWFVNDILSSQSTAHQRTKVRAARHSKILFSPSTN